MLAIEEKYIYNILEHLKRKAPFSLSLKDAEKRIKNASAFFKKAVSTDSTLLFLMKQHARAELLTFTFLSLLPVDLINNNQIHSFAQSALLYVYQNVKAFMDLVHNSSRREKGAKSEKKMFIK